MQPLRRDRATGCRYPSAIGPTRTPGTSPAAGIRAGPPGIRGGKPARPVERRQNVGYDYSRLVWLLSLCERWRRKCGRLGRLDGRPAYRLFPLRLKPVLMSDTLTVGLTDKQRELLLRGLKHVRSSVMLEIREPSAEDEEQRRGQLRDIAALTEQLGSVKRRSAD